MQDKSNDPCFKLFRVGGELFRYCLYLERKVKTKDREIKRLKARNAKLVKEAEKINNTQLVEALEELTEPFKDSTCNPDINCKAYCQYTNTCLVYKTVVRQ